MKEVVLIGASGFVGTAILNELLNRNYKVTAVVRNPEKMSVKNPALTVVKADVSDVKAIAAICAGKEAVISAYNPGWTNPNIYEDTLKNYPLILEAVKRSGAKRFLCVGGAGTLFCAPGLRVVFFCHPFSKTSDEKTGYLGFLWRSSIVPLFYLTKRYQNGSR
jgi:putative NADH-flavin reductase